MAYIERYSTRNWAVYDRHGNLVCVTLYKKGAVKVLELLNELETLSTSRLKEEHHAARA